MALFTGETHVTEGGLVYKVPASNVSGLPAPPSDPPVALYEASAGIAYACPPGPMPPVTSGPMAGHGMELLHHDGFALR